MGNLSNLENLHLGSNQLSGTIPVELGNLSNLRSLFLSWNQLSGTIPVELGNLPNLTYLYLEGNQLSGEIPTELGNLTDLTRLFLGWNQLDGSIPSELGNLTNLTYLGLHDNRSLTGALPQSLIGLTKLEEFKFENAGLCAPSDAAFQMWLQGIEEFNGPDLRPSLRLSRTARGIGGTV